MAYDYHKEAKASRAKKLKSYKSADPHQKVDSSDWTPAEPLNTEAKTGLRPVSRRQYKRGGKVMHKIEGAHSKMRHDRKGRKSGGKAGEMPTVDRFINKDMKKANEYRDGEKHVGGMKKGGRANKDMGGPLNMMNPVLAAGNRLNAMNAAGNTGVSGITPGMPTGAAGKSIMRMKGLGMKKGGKIAHPDEAADKQLIKKMVKPSARTGKSGGGKTEKDFLSPVGQKQRRLDELKKQMLRTDPKVTPKGDWGDMQAERDRLEYDLSQAYKPIRDTRAEGGKVFSGKGYPFKVPGADGGRTARAAGGRKAKMGGGGFPPNESTQYEMARRPAVEAGQEVDIDPVDLARKTKNFERVAGETGYSNRKHGGRSKHASGGKVGKGKTNINIVIAPHGGQPQQGQPAPMGGMMPPMPVPQPNKPPMPGAPMGGMPMGMDPNLALLAARGGAGPQQQPPMQPPMGRKAGGRVQTQHVIDNAAGGGLGRLEKIKAYGHKAK